MFTGIKNAFDCSAKFTRNLFYPNDLRTPINTNKIKQDVIELFGGCQLQIFAAQVPSPEF
jgi:hypothetical protein